MAVLIGIVLMAIAAGVFGSMLGVGGGIIMVPVLSLAFGVPIKTAIATSIVCVIATSSMAQTAYVGRGLTNVRLGMLLEVATCVGAVAGVVIAVAVEARYLQVSFAVLLVYVALQMNRQGITGGRGRSGALQDTYYDPAEGSAVTYGAGHVRLGFVLSLGAGGVSGLLGVGGGAFQVPIMHLLMGVPLKATIATSNLMIGVTAATGAAIFYGRGFVDPLYVIPAALGILAGARLGPVLAARLPSRALARAFQLVLLVFAVLMILTAAGLSS